MKIAVGEKFSPKTQKNAFPAEGGLLKKAALADNEDLGLPHLKLLNTNCAGPVAGFRVTSKSEVTARDSAAGRGLTKKTPSLSRLQPESAAGCGI